MDKNNNKIRIVKLSSLKTLVSAFYLSHYEKLVQLEREVKEMLNFGNEITCNYSLTDGVTVSVDACGKTLTADLSSIIDFLMTHGKIDFNDFVELSNNRD